MIFKYTVNTSWNWPGQILCGHFTNEKVELSLKAIEMKQWDWDHNVTDLSSEYTPGIQSSVLQLPQLKWWRPTAYSGLLGGKESTCWAGDMGLIPGLGKSPGEGSDNSF